MLLKTAINPSVLAAAVAIFSSSVACNKHSRGEANEKRIDVEIRNQSGKDLNWIELNWDGPHVPGGIIPDGVWSTAVDVVYTKPSSASVTFIDDASIRDENRTHYKLMFTLTDVNNLEQSLIEKLSFVITSYTTAEVHVNGKKISEATAPPPAPDAQ